MEMLRICGTPSESSEWPKIFVVEAIFGSIFGHFQCCFSDFFGANGQDIEIFLASRALEYFIGALEGIWNGQAAIQRLRCCKT